MPKLNQRGAIQYLILLILIAGLIAGVYLVQKTQIFKPKASVSGPLTPTTSFVFSTQGTNFRVGDTIAVKLLVRSDISAANLFESKINFNKDLLSVDRIDYSSSLITNWVEQYSDNSTGTISLVGGVTNPGYQTDVNSAPALMAVIHFKALASGNATLSFADTSTIYSNADNANILVGKNPITLSLISGGVSQPITPTPTPTSTPSPTATPTPVATPVPGTGDGNGDGKINLADLSVLLSDFNKESGFRRGIDLNGDGKINSFDFSLMRNLLIEKKVIRG